jgi:hypothetical protein
MDTANTEYTYVFAAGRKNHDLSLRDLTKAWRFSWTQGVVAAGGGTQIGAGFGLEIPENMSGATGYFACGSASMTMQINYDAPKVT